METRLFTENQIHVFLLVMNDMRDRCEGATIAAISTDYDYLVNWYREQFATEPYRDKEPYDEHSWYKAFKKGSVLEWYNPISNTELNHCDYFNRGIKDMWINERKLPEVQSNYNVIYTG